MTTDGTIMLTAATADRSAGEPDDTWASTSESEEGAFSDAGDEAKPPSQTDFSAKAAAKVDELVDVGFGGKSYRLPKELKSALLMHANYTRKTQDLAEQRPRKISTGRAPTRSPSGCRRRCLRTRRAVGSRHRCSS